VPSRCDRRLRSGHIGGECELCLADFNCSCSGSGWHSCYGRAILTALFGAKIDRVPH